jgi:hypothetical protein
MHCFVLLLILASSVMADTPTCVSYFSTDLQPDTLNATGTPGLANSCLASCPFQLLYSIDPDGNAISAITQIDVSKADNLTISDTVLNARSIGTAVNFFQNAGTFVTYVLSLNVRLIVFAYDSSTCTEYVVHNVSCPRSGIVIDANMPCYQFPDCQVNIGEYSCPIVILPYPNTYALPYYMKITASPSLPFNSTADNEHFSMAALAINSQSIPFVNELVVGGCNDPLYLNEFQDPYECICPPPGIYPIRDTVMTQVTAAENCSGWGVSLDASSNPGTFGFSIPLSSFNFANNPTFNYIEFNILTGGSVGNIEATATFSDSCDHFSDQATFFYGGNEVNVAPTCGITDQPNMWSWSTSGSNSLPILVSPTSADGSFVVLFKLSGSAPAQIFISSINVSVSVGLSTKVHQFNNQTCAAPSGPDIAPAACECITGNCSYIADFEGGGIERRRTPPAYPPQPVDATPFYYSAPFIIDTAGVQDYSGGGGGSRRRHIPVSADQTNSFLNFIFEEDQYLFPYNASYPGAYSIGSTLSDEHNCGIHVHVLSCSNNIQVWLRPRINFKEMPSYYDYGPVAEPELFKCNVVTSSDITSVYPLSENTRVYIMSTVGDAVPPQSVWDVVFFGAFPNGTLINLDNITFGFEIQQPLLKSPDTGIYIRCEIGTPYNGTSPSDQYTYNPIFAGMNYCQSSDSSNGTFTDVVPIPLFDTPSVPPLNPPTTPGSVTRRHVHFMAANLCGSNLGLCANNGWKFGEPFDYIPDYVGPAYMFPQGPINTTLASSYTVYMAYELDNLIFGEIVAAGQINASSPTFEFNLIMNYALNDEYTSLFGPNVAVIYPDCTSYDCDVIPNILGVQMPILEGFEMYLHEDTFVSDHYKISMGLTSCISGALAQYATTNNVVLNISQIQIAVEMGVEVFASEGDYGNDDYMPFTPYKSVLQRTLIHGMTIDMYPGFTANDTRIELLHTPRPECAEAPFPEPLCPSCPTNITLATPLYRNTVGALIGSEGCPVFTLQLTPAQNHYQSFIGVSLDLGSLGVQFVDYTDTATYSNSLQNGVFVQAAKIRFVADYSWVQRVSMNTSIFIGRGSGTMQNLVQAVYERYCDDFAYPFAGGPFSEGYDYYYPIDAPQDPRFGVDVILDDPCGSSLFADPVVIEFTIPFFKGFTPTAYPTYEDKALLFLFRDILPTDSIVIEYIQLIVSSLNDCGSACTGNYTYNTLIYPTPCREQTQPGECLCRGCGYKGGSGENGIGDNITSGVNYFASPVIIDDGIYSAGSPDYTIPDPGERRRAPPTPIVSGVAPELNDYFTQTHVIFTYQLNSSIPLQNQDDLIGETVVMGCGIYVHNKNCSSNIQVWLNPAHQFYVMLPHTASESRSPSDSKSHESKSHHSDSKSLHSQSQSQSGSLSTSQQSNSQADRRRGDDAPQVPEKRRRSHGFPYAYEVNAVARCAVTADYNYPLGVFALTNNVVIRTHIVPYPTPPGVSEPIYLYTQQQWTVDIIYNLTYLNAYTILAQTMGPYGFEIERPMGEGLSGFYVDCDLYLGHGEIDGTPVAVPLYANKSYCEPRRAPVYPVAFNTPFDPVDYYYDDSLQPAVPRIHLFGTPLCPSVSMCPSNSWFFNAPYNYTEDYMGPAYVFPAYPLSQSETIPFLQTVYFRFSEPTFLALVKEGASKGQQMGMILTLAIGQSATLDNVDFSILFDETLCGEPACRLSYGGFGFSAVQTAVLGTGARATSAIYKDHLILTFVFDEVCFDLFNFTAAADKYMMQLTINGSTVNPDAEPFIRNYTSTIFGRVLLEGVRFFLVETYYDVRIAWQNINAYQNVLYLPDPDCTRKAFTPSYLCDGQCHVSQLDPAVFPNFANASNVSLIIPVTGPYRGIEGGGVDPTYEQLGLNYTLLQNALNLTQQGYYEDYGLTNQLFARVFNEVYQTGAQLVLNVDINGEPFVEFNATLAILAQFDPNITRVFLNNYGNTLAPPFIPGAYLQYDPVGGSVNFFGVGVAVGFLVSEDGGVPLAAINPVFIFVTGTYENLCALDNAAPSHNTDKDVVCNSTSMQTLSSLAMPQNATVVVYGVGEPGYPIVIDPQSEPFLEIIGSYGLLQSPFALPFPPVYNLQGANPEALSFRLGSNWTEGGILGSNPLNRTGIGFFNGTGFNFQMTNVSSGSITYEARWLFTAEPCVPEPYDPFPYTTSRSQSQTPALQTHSQSHHSPSHESESHSKSHHSRSHESESHHSESHSHSHESKSHHSESHSHNSQSPSVPNNPEECCNSSILQVGVTRNEANLCGANPNGIILPPNGPVFGCSYLDLPPAIYAGGIYQLRDHFIAFNASNPHLNELGRMGLRVGNVWLTFSEAGADMKYYFTPGLGKVILGGKAWGRINNGTCTLGVIPLHLVPQLYEVHIEMSTGLHVLYGAPGADVNFLVSENATLPPHQRILIADSIVNTGYFYPVGHSDWNVSFGLADMSPVYNTIPGLGPLAVDYSPVQFFTALSLPGLYTGTFTGAGAFQVTCPATGNPNSTRYILHNYACSPFFGPAESGYGMFMFDIEAACNDCAPTPTPAVCPPNETHSGVPHTHTHTGSQSQSADLQSLSPNPISPTPFPPLYREYNQSCYSGATYTKCGLMTAAVFAPDIWLDPAVMYGAIPFPENSPFSDFQMQLIQFNHTLVKSGQRFIKFWVPNMPGRTSVYLTVYLWSEIAVSPDDSSSSNSDWEPSQEGDYIIPPNLVVLVGAGDSARVVCNRVADISKCNVPFPEYGGYLYLGVATQPRYALGYDVGFVYVEMLMINGRGFDDTFSVQPVVGVPNCVMLNVSVGTPHDPACNLAWDSAIPALGSNAYTETLAASTVGLFVMGGLGASALAFNIYGVDTMSTLWSVAVMGALNVTAMLFSGTVATAISVTIILGSFGAMGAFLYLKKRRMAAPENRPMSLNAAVEMPADEFIARDENGRIVRNDSMELTSLHAVVAAENDETDDIAALYASPMGPRDPPREDAILIPDGDMFDVEGEIPIQQKETTYEKDVDE